MNNYSPKPLVQKLGYTPEHKVWVHNAPKSFWGELYAASIPSTPHLPADWAHIFVHRQQQLHEVLQQPDLAQINSGLWISWPKKSSGQLTDITEQTLRDFILPLGWVDIKVCAIDDIWSALKFVPRKS